MAEIDSGTKGILTAHQVSLHGRDLMRWMQQYIVMLTGMVGDRVIPCVQPDASDNPEGEWIAIRPIAVRNNWSFIAGQSSFSKFGGQSRGQEIDFLISAFGQFPADMLSLLESSLSVGQNREYLRAQDAGIVTSGNIAVIPDISKAGQGRYRADLTLTLQRRLVVEYRIEHLRAATLLLNHETGTRPIDIKEA